MLFFLQIFNSLIFLGLSALHFYWAFCSYFGKKAWAIDASVPENDGKALFLPSSFSAIVVAIGLLAFAKISSFNLLPGIGLQKFGSMWPYLNLAISIIFLVRAFGEFKYVGFFKKVKGTKFANYDTKYYSPLCLLLSVFAFIIYWHYRQ